MSVRITSLVNYLLNVPGPIETIFKPRQVLTFQYVEYDEVINDERIVELIQQERILTEDLESQQIVKASPPSIDNMLTRWDGVGGNRLQDSGIVVEDNGKTTFPGSGAIPDLFTIDPTANQWASRGAPEPGYVATIRGSGTENGLFLKAADNPGTYPIHIEDDPSTTQFLHMEHDGLLGLGTVNPHYGIDLARDAGNSCCINTAKGLFLIEGERANDAVSVYDRAGSQTFTGTVTMNLDTTSIIGNLYTLASDIVTVRTAGRYLISYGFVTRLVSGGISCVEGDLQSAPGALFLDVRGAKTRSWVYYANSGASLSIVKDVVARERFRVQLSRVYGSATCGLIANAGFLLFVRLS